MDNKEKLEKLHKHVQNLDKLLNDCDQGISLALGIILHEEWQAVVDLWCGSANVTKCPKVLETQKEEYKEKVLQEAYADLRMHVAFNNITSPIVARDYRNITKKIMKELADKLTVKPT